LAALFLSWRRWPGHLQFCPFFPIFPRFLSIAVAVIFPQLGFCRSIERDLRDARE
jgi:hypothetical protein